MLEEYLGHIGPNAAFFDVISLNSPVSTIAGLDEEVLAELVDELPSLDPDPETVCERLDALNKVGAFVETLPPQLKITATLHYWDGLTQVEVATRLKISQPAVSQRLSKIVSMGRQYFDLAA